MRAFTCPLNCSILQSAIACLEPKASAEARGILTTQRIFPDERRPRACLSQPRADPSSDGSTRHSSPPFSCPALRPPPVRAHRIRRTWVLDPIDGTKSFITGKPLFGTLIALVHSASGRPVLGVIDQPVLKERRAGDAAQRPAGGPASAAGAARPAGGAVKAGRHGRRRRNRRRCWAAPLGAADVCGPWPLGQRTTALTLEKSRSRVGRISARC